MKQPAAARGQTLVLFALSMLLISLLVLMTLSLSTRVKEKMELQAVADAAAYSNAVVTARAYNEIALLSRAQIGKMVSLASVQSLISWSSYYRAQVEATRQAYNVAKIPYIALLPCCIPTSGCTQFCSCARQAIQDIDDARDKLDEHQQELDEKWQDLDEAAAGQTKRLQGAAALLYGAQLERYFKLRGKLDGQTVVKDIVEKAKEGSNWPGEWSAPGSGDDVTVDESVGIPLIGGGDVKGGAIIPVNVTTNHHVYAAMGSRGYSFVTQRFMGAMIITGKIQEKLPERDTVMVTNEGNAYFAKDMNHGELFPDGTFAWADDHGVSTVTFNRGQSPCLPTSAGAAAASAYVKATDSDNDKDEHEWSPGGIPDEEPPDERHTLGPCIDCPGVWPMFVDYNPAQLLGGGNLWGQPKNFAVIQRNYAVRMTPGNRDPWIRNFTFNFTDSTESADSRFDNRGIFLSPQNGGINISRQTAVSTGIAYYHRYGHWKEPPNLLNPYWRATLVPFDVDSDGSKDLRKTLEDVGVDWAADAAKALKDHGYNGGP
jgi:hypothetical protein